MKRLLLAVIFSSLVCSPVLANAQLDADINEKLSSIGFGKLFAFDPQEQIKNLFKDYENSGNNHKLNQLKNFYSEKYVNGDGFSYASYFDLVKQTWEMYPDIEYSFEVKNIIVNGDYATVQVYETAKGTAKEPSEYLEDKGQLESVLFNIQNDIYYPTFIDKLTHLIFCLVKFHIFNDGNKRTAIACSSYFLQINRL